MATTDVRPDLYYDPYDRVIDADPYPVFTPGSATKRRSTTTSSTTSTR